MHMFSLCLAGNKIAGNMGGSNQFEKKEIQHLQLIYKKVGVSYMKISNLFLKNKFDCEKLKKNIVSKCNIFSR